LIKSHSPITKCPKCGADLKKMIIFKETVLQCTECSYKTIEEESSVKVPFDARYDAHLLEE